MNLRVLAAGFCVCVMVTGGCEGEVVTDEVTSPIEEPPVLAVCGNGVLDVGEQCDDGNGRDDDACPDGVAGTCIPAYCGDGFVLLGIELCDAELLNSDELADACRTDCTLPVCGDGIVDDGEACDDGNQADDDDCRVACEIPECGDGIIDVHLGEGCDAGADNSDSTPNQCRLDCVLPMCGDGVVDDEFDDCDLEVVNRNRFPVRLDVAPNGDVYVSDAHAGSVFVYDSSLNLVAEHKNFISPLGVAVGSNGTFYVGADCPDDENDKVHIISASGERIGTAGEGMLRMATDFALDVDGNLYVVDSRLRIVRVFDSAGVWLSDIGEPDDGNGVLLDSELLFPTSVAVGMVDAQGGTELYVADQANFRVVVFTLDGQVVRTLGSQRKLISDYQGKFAKLQSLLIDQHGRLHALDSQMALVQILDAQSGAYLAEYGGLGTALGELSLPLDIALTADHRVLVANNQNHRIEFIYAVPPTSTIP